MHSLVSTADLSVITTAKPSVFEAERFGAPLLPGPEVAGHLPDMLSKLGIAGGAVYDAHVALAAAEHNAELATRDARAKTTYEICGVEVLIVG